MKETRGQWKKIILILLIFLLAIVIRFIQPLQFPVLHWDEGLWNLGPKHALLLNDPIAFHFGHPFLSPLHYLTTLLLYTLFSPSLAVSRWLCGIFGVGAIFFTYLLGKRLGNKQIAFIASLFCAYNSLMILYSRYALLEMEVCFYMVAASYFWFHPRSRYVWFGGILLAGALLVKANALALLPALILGQLLFRPPETPTRNPVLRRISKVQWLSIAASICIAFVGYYLISRLNPELFLETWGAHSVRRVSRALGSDTFYSVGTLFSTLRFQKQFVGHFPDLLILAVLGLVLGIVKRRTSVYFLLGWLFFTFLLVSAQSMRSSHYYYPTIPAIAILAAIGLCEIFPVNRIKRWKAFLLYFVVSVLCLVQLIRFVPYYQDGVRANRHYFKIVNDLKTLLEPDEPFLSTGFTMLLVENPVVPLAQFIEDRWRILQDSTLKPTIPWPRYAVLRRFSEFEPTPYHKWRNRFIAETFEPIDSNRDRLWRNLGYIGKSKYPTLHLEELPDR